MEKLFEVIEKGMMIKGLDDLTIAFYMIILIISSLLFGYFLKYHNKVHEKEQENFSNILQEYSNIIILIMKFRNKEVSEKELFYNISKLLPFCSDNLRKKIYDYDNLYDYQGQKKSSTSIEEINNLVISEFSSLRFYNKGNIFKKIGLSSVDNLEYSISFSGAKGILSAIGYTLLNLSIILLLTLFIIGLSTVGTIVEQIQLISLVLFILFYLMFLLFLIDSFMIKKLKKGKIILIIINFFLPCLTFVFQNLWSTLFSLILLMILSYYNLGKSFEFRNDN